MLRNTRTIAALIRHIMLGTAATLATATLASSFVGCKDESQPDYWVDKLQDPKWRPRAVKRLDQFYQDALTRAGGKEDHPDVKKLVAKTIEPLTKAYVEGYADYDAKTRVSLIKLVASYRDQGTEPALKKALEEFAKRPSTKAEDEDIKWVIRAQEDLKLASLNPLLIDVFQKVKASSMLGGKVYKDLNATMLEVADKGWSESLKKMLEADMVPPDEKNKDSFDTYRNQIFWQTVAAQVLGEVRDPSAVQPLLKVVLDPAKGPVATTAVLALVKIGAPAVDAAVKLLKGEDKALVEFHTQRVMKVGKLEKPPEDEPHIAMAAIVLGSAGRPEAIAPMLEVIKSTSKDQNKAVILRELAKIPATPESKAAFKAGFEGLGMDTRMPPSGSKALPSLVEEAVPRFYDSDMIPWLIERGEQAKGDPDDLRDLRGTILLTVLKLAKPADIAKAEELLGKWGTKQDGKVYEKPMFDLTKELLQACGDRAPCYLEQIQKSDAQKSDTQFKGIKAGYMLAIFGDDKTAEQIVDKMSALENAAVRYTASQAIDHLLPSGSEGLAKRLEEIVKKNLDTGDKDKIAGDAVLKEVLYRVRARAAK